MTDLRMSEARLPEPRTTDPRATEPLEPAAAAVHPEAIGHAVVETGLGRLTLVAGRAGLTGLYFEGHRHLPDPARFGPAVPESDPRFADAAAQLRAYLAGERVEFDVPLAAAGTAFQRAVWSALDRIPHGSTTTYGAIAAALGSPKAVRAVGLAVGRNPISIIVPCHRVVGANGALTGYAGGVDRKRRLLELEGALPRTLAG
jgi:methylated-DNA-[protein]-cysteine S-methyltransferase